MTTPSDTARGSEQAAGARVPGTIYRFVRPLDLGRGDLGGGQVWIVRHAELDQELVMKLLPLGHPEREAIALRMQRVDVRAQTGFRHPNLVRVLDLGVTSMGQPYFVLEKLSGRTLRDELSASSHVACSRALDVARQMLDGLSAAHGAGAVHRDLRPEKVFLQTGGVVKLLGFGKILDLGSEGVLSPVPSRPGQERPSPYLAPEVALAGSAALDARADVFSAGVVLYEMLVGKVPFPASPPEHPPVPPSTIAAQELPEGLDALVMRALCVDPAGRFAHAGAFAAELERIAARLAPRTKRPRLALGDSEPPAKWDITRDATFPGEEVARSGRYGRPSGAALSFVGVASDGESLYAIAPGTVLAGKYKVVRTLGKGGMGLVVEAVHMSLDTRVAMKFLLPEHMQNGEACGRFLREARAASKLESPNVARVIDVGTLDGGEPYMVMEYLAGEDLSQHSRGARFVAVGDAIEWITQASDAIAEAHSLGIVHRDLKPANLFLTRRGDGSQQVKVLDFGISKVLGEGDGDVALTQTTTILGSALYMSPEQMRSAKNVDFRTDVYALGVCLFELLAREPPYFAATFPELCAKIYTSPPRSLQSLRPDAPRALQATIEKAIAREPEERYQSIAELVQALSPFARSDTRAKMQALLRRHGPALALLPPIDLETTAPISARQTGRAPRTRRQGSRWPALLLIALVAVAAWGSIASGLVPPVWQRFFPGAPPPAPVAAGPPSAQRPELVAASATAAPRLETTARPDQGAGLDAGSAGLEPDGGALDVGSDASSFADGRDAAAALDRVPDATASSVVVPDAAADARASVPAPPPAAASERGSPEGYGYAGPAAIPHATATPAPPVNTELGQETCTATLPDGTKKSVPCN